MVKDSEPSMEESTSAFLNARDADANLSKRVFKRKWAAQYKSHHVIHPKMWDVVYHLHWCLGLWIIGPAAKDSILRYICANIYVMT